MAQTVFTFPCPCCDKWIEVDVRSGKARAARPQEAKGGRDLDQLLGEHQKQSQKLGDLFDAAQQQVKKQKDLLEEQLRRAKEDARKNPDEKPRNPFDLD